MPNYDFECASCGPFTENRPMAQSAEPCACPECGAMSPRGFFSAPAMFGMEGAARRAHAVNEESRAAPKRLSKSETYDMKHRAGCACCASTNRKKGVFRADGARTFPSARPWMISH